LDEGDDGAETDFVKGALEGSEERVEDGKDGGGNLAEGVEEGRESRLEVSGDGAEDGTQTRDRSSGRVNLLEEARHGAQDTLGGASDCLSGGVVATEGNDLGDVGETAETAGGAGDGSDDGFEVALNGGDDLLGVTAQVGERALDVGDEGSDSRLKITEDTANRAQKPLQLPLPLTVTSGDRGHIRDGQREVEVEVGDGSDVEVDVLTLVSSDVETDHGERGVKTSVDGARRDVETGVSDGGDIGIGDDVGLDGEGDGQSSEGDVADERHFEGLGFDI